MEFFNNKKALIVTVVALVIGVGLGYWAGKTAVSPETYQSGYDKAIADTKASQEEVAKQAGEEAAKAANPFQAANPLEGVKANPFDDAAKKLNPFSE